MESVVPAAGAAATPPASHEESVPPVRRQRAAAPGSLRDRMRRRREQVASRTTELFPVPLYDSVLAVEFRVVEWEESEEIITSHMREQRRQMLLNAADELVEATVAFYELPENGIAEPIEDARTWADIVEAYLEEEMPDAPHRTRERVAMTELCTEQGVMALSGQYRRWLGGADVGIGKEVRRDFRTTT